MFLRFVRMLKSRSELRMEKLKRDQELHQLQQQKATEEVEKNTRNSK